MRFPRLALGALAATLLISGCGKSTSPTALNETPGDDTPTLDTAPPPAPEGLSFVLNPSTGSGRLTWSPSSAVDVAGYDIFVYSPDPSREDSYVYLHTTDTASNEYSLNPVGEVTTRFYRVRAVDSSGNRSGLSSTLSVELWPSTNGAPPNGSPVGHMDP